MTTLLCASCTTAGVPHNNDADRAHYAAFMVQEAQSRNIACLWWDCSNLINREELTLNAPLVVQAITQPFEHFIPLTGNTAFEPAETAVHNMRTGINLGNTLDSTSYKHGSTEDGWIVQWGNGTPAAWETAWGQPVTTPQMIALMQRSGFSTVRVPVTWAEHLSADGTVDAAWMQRVQEVVDYVIDAGMYCILNVHHDGGANGWIAATEQRYTEYSDRFAQLWRQIAERFSDYGERLLFESMNEVLDGNGNWTASSECNAVINKWNALFVQTVRATGGNNASRNLIVMPYAGDGSEAALQEFSLPPDSVQNHLIVEVHNYDPTEFTWKQENISWTTATATWNAAVFEPRLRAELDILQRYAQALGAPFIIGEYAAEPKTK